MNEFFKDAHSCLLVRFPESWISLLQSFLHYLGSSKQKLKDIDEVYAKVFQVQKLMWIYF